MKSSRFLRIVSLTILCALLLAGCAVRPAAAQESPATAEPYITATPIFSAAPTVEPTPEPTPEPTAEPTPTPSATPAPTATPTPEPTPESAAQSILRGMTLREKAAQLFIVTPEALANVTEGYCTGMTEPMAETLSACGVGGVILFGGNITDPGQLSAFTAALHTASAVPPLLCVDEEGGLVARLANNYAFSLPRYENAAAVGASGSSADALEMGRTIGAYLREYGFDLDFAPVADVNTNPYNPVIGTRAFSSDPAIAAVMAEAFAAGLGENGVTATYKHFPGHGDTAEDSHAGLAVSYKTREELAACEWLPYRSVPANCCVMAGHIALPNVTGEWVPASLSHAVITDILRSELGFSGVVVTDALAMGAITESYGAEEAALLALEAGCDLLLMPASFPAALEAVIAAVESGRISEARLDESVARILAMKENCGLIGF